MKVKARQEVSGISDRKVISKTFHHYLNVFFFSLSVYSLPPIITVLLGYRHFPVIVTLLICLKPSYIESYKEKGFTARQMFGIQEIQRTEEQKTMNKKTEK